MLAVDILKKDKLQEWVEKNVACKLCTEEKTDSLKDYMKIKKIIISLWKPKLQIFEERDFRMKGYLDMDHIKDLKGAELGKTTIASTETWFEEEELVIKLVPTSQVKDLKGKVWQGLDENGNDLYEAEGEEKVEEIKESDLF